MKTHLQKISGSSKHSAFTDLCLWQNHLYCCFREATNHISKDGRIKIQKLNLSGEVVARTTIHLPGCDLRDPKLTEDPQGRLLLLVYRKQFDRQGNFCDGRPMSFFSTTGLSWSSGKLIGDSGWWLWRIRWHQQSSHVNNKVFPRAYGFAYNRSQQAINLYAGIAGGNLELTKKEALSLKSHQLGYPNESDIVFKNNIAMAIVRRDADSCTAQFGLSCFPFKRWQWLDLGIYLGGPCMIEKSETEMWLSGRIWENQRFTTRIYVLNTESMTLRSFFDLPSGGDNSYPGMVQHNNRLYVSYYSSHIDQKSQIYLATFELENET